MLWDFSLAPDEDGVLAFEVGFATWFQSVPPRVACDPSSFPGANMVLAHCLLFFLPFSAIRYTLYGRVRR